MIMFLGEMRFAWGDSLLAWAYHTEQAAQDIG